jgi:hypothetical protein
MFIVLSDDMSVAPMYLQPYIIMFHILDQLFALSWSGTPYTQKKELNEKGNVRDPLEYNPSYLARVLRTCQYRRDVVCCS